MEHKTTFKITSKAIKGKQKLEVKDQKNEVPEFCKNSVTELLLVCGAIAQKMAKLDRSFREDYTCIVALSFIDKGQGTVDVQFSTKNQKGVVFINGIQLFLDKDLEFMQAMGFSLNGGKND